MALLKRGGIDLTSRTIAALRRRHTIVTVVPCQGPTPLHTAISRRYLASSQLLVNCSSLPGGRTEHLSQSTFTGRPVLPGYFEQGRRYLSSLPSEERNEKKNTPSSDPRIHGFPVHKHVLRRKLQEEKLESALAKGGKSQLNVSEAVPKLSEKVVTHIKNTPKYIVNGAKATVGAIKIAVTDPKRAREYMKGIYDTVMHELQHYWLGTKLLVAEVKTAVSVSKRLLKGHALTRRERRQLTRTTTDIFRLVPFSVFIIVPFMELLLPVALKLFPNMLPSTYQDRLSKEEKMKKELKMRLALAEFLQETVGEMAASADSGEISQEGKNASKRLLDFMNKSRRGEALSNEEIIEIARCFKDELTLDNVTRPQLVAMCRYMGLSPFGTDTLLRFHLRAKLRKLKADDMDILWEGLDSLDKEELQQACQERGMRSTGLTKAGYKRQLKQWLDLSVNKNVPASLLVLSRAFNITALADTPEAALATSISALNEEVVNEVVLESAKSSKQVERELTELKLESLRYQNEMIADEEKARQRELEKKAKETAEAVAASAVDAAPLAAVQAAAAKPDERMAPASIAADVMSQKEALKDEPLMVDKYAEDSPAVQQQQQPSKPAPSLTVEEVAALESLAFESSVAKERKALEDLKKQKGDMDVDAMLAAGRIGGAKIFEARSKAFVARKLDSMLKNLEVELEKVDQKIGDKLNVLDKDKDGVLSSEELTNAVMQILRNHDTIEKAQSVVRQIDENNDGLVTLEELVKWVEERRDLLEVPEGTDSKTKAAAANASGEAVAKAATAAIIAAAATATATSTSATPSSTSEKPSTHNAKQ